MICGSAEHKKPKCPNRSKRRKDGEERGTRVSNMISLRPTEISVNIERTREKVFPCMVHGGTTTDTYKCGKQGCHLGYCNQLVLIKNSIIDLTVPGLDKQIKICSLPIFGVNYCTKHYLLNSKSTATDTQNKLHKLFNDRFINTHEFCLSQDESHWTMEVKDPQFFSQQLQQSSIAVIDNQSNTLPEGDEDNELPEDLLPGIGGIYDVDVDEMDIEDIENELGKGLNLSEQAQNRHNQMKAEIAKENENSDGLTLNYTDEPHFF